MSKLNHQGTSQVVSRHWAWLLPLFALTSLSLAGSACSNSGVIGDDCPDMNDCATGGSAGSGSGNPVNTSCGGQLGTTCAKGLYCEYSIASACGATDQTGVCKATPDACDDIYAPVCGCDDKTYSSDCVAHSAGVSVASQGECEGNGSGGSNNGGGGTGSGGGTTCGGILPKDCPADQFCNYPAAAQCGSGDQTGFCSAKPQACDLIYAPVCGCDGKTYGSDCAAAGAGVSVAKTGECAVTTGKSCGGRGGGTCASGEYCNYKPAAMCGRADATGTCAKITDGACTANYDPVCGCDGMTYGNDCEAAHAGAAIDHTGACATTGDVCGGLLGTGCKSGFFCNYPLAMACGNADGTGNCSAIPQVCNDIAAPVCGCDGKPYGNACEANAKGTSVAKNGACK